MRARVISGACSPSVLASVVLALSAIACGGGFHHVKAGKPVATPEPSWVLRMRGDATKVCGMGVAGAGFEDSPYPKEAARQRAVENLAGIISTEVEDAMIDNESTDGEDVDYARVVQVDDSLIKVIDGMASVEYWLDVDGKGPYGAKLFTYAWSCIPKTDATTTLKLAPTALSRPSATNGNGATALADEPPLWLNDGGKKKNGRFCAVGYSDPTFQSENTFANVVIDVRAQLATTVSTLVASYFDEQTTDQSQYIQSMTASSNKQLAKGVVVTKFWYDVKGKGPKSIKRSTYGYGCVYPMDIVASSLANTAMPQETVDSVRDHAQHAFDALDAEESKQRASK